MKVQLEGSTLLLNVYVDFYINHSLLQTLSLSVYILLFNLMFNYNATQRMLLKTSSEEFSSNFNGLHSVHFRQI